MAEYVIPSPFQYGVPELKKNYQKYFTRGLVIATIVHLAMIGTYWGAEYLAREEEPTVVVRVMKYSDIGPPPSITDSQAAPAIAVASTAVKPSVGIPVPVPDAEINPEQTIATQSEMSSIADPLLTDGSGDGSGQTVIEQDIRDIVIDEAPADFVPYEKAPMVVKRPAPVYPEIARKAGVEGTVWLKLWIDKEGKVKKAIVVKSDSEVLDQAAIDAAMQWVFTPALQRDKPVAVWMSIPFKFKLN
jgi:periplasmic protein TonB